MATLEEKIARINELYHKSKTDEGLTLEELEEQQHQSGFYAFQDQLEMLRFER